MKAIKVAAKGIAKKIYEFVPVGTWEEVDPGFQKASCVKLRKLFPKVLKSDKDWKAHRIMKERYKHDVRSEHKAHSAVPTTISDHDLDHNIDS